jgi:hypothetical protein
MTATRYPGFARPWDHQRGFRGWLVYFYAANCIAAVLRGYYLFQSGSSLHVFASAEISAAVLAASVLQTAIHAAFFLATLYGLAVFAKCDPRTAAFWGIFLILSIPGLLALEAIVAYVSSEVQGSEFGDVFWRLLRDGGARAMLFSLLWALYWMRSQRVRLTFGANTFGRRVDAPSTSVAPVT